MNLLPLLLLAVVAKARVAKVAKAAVVVKATVLLPSTTSISPSLVKRRSKSLHRKVPLNSRLIT